MTDMPMRDNEREYHESISVARGLVFASVIALGFWGSVAGVVALVVTAL